jgi:DNA adenine methylase
VLRAPFPYFGGKRRAASLVWEALGNVANYVEPFAGSAAVLLARPHVGRCETINDLDGMVANFWRAVRSQPDAVAEACDWPVIEADLHARHLWLIGQRESLTARLIADPDWCDPKAAGWWCWGAAAWIGDGWCSAGKPPRTLPFFWHSGMGFPSCKAGKVWLSKGGHAPAEATGTTPSVSSPATSRESFDCFIMFNLS